MAQGGAGLQVGLGVASETGRRRRNEDFAGAWPGSAGQRAAHGVVAALADGMGGGPGGREAAETAVRGFLDGYYAQPETAEVQRAGSAVLDALNRWIFAIGRTDPGLAGMGCTFTALILRGRSAHCLHVGDTRLYRLTAGRLIRLTEDHTLNRPGMTHVLYRAVGIEESVRLDYARHPVERHDRFLLCSDGVHASLSDAALADILGRRSAPGDAAGEIVAAALAAGSADNASAVVVDVTALPEADLADLGGWLLPLPIGELPKTGEVVDGFRLDRQISDGRYARLFAAVDGDGARVALKFPHPRVAAESACKAAFLREAWVAARVRSPFVGRVIEAPPERRSRLYTVMPLYEGETLAQRLGRRPLLPLEDGRAIAVRLGRAVAALHRCGILHRDIKPDNVILESEGGLKLVDLGVAHVRGLAEAAPGDNPGTAGYMAPELFAGAPADERTDLFALGVTLFEAFTGALPYGEIEPFSHPRFGRPKALTALRPDLPAWLEATLARALAVDPADRYGDVAEFIIELENGPLAESGTRAGKLPLYCRDPLLFWRAVSALLAAGLLVLALYRR